MKTAKIGSSTSRPRCKKGDFRFIGNTVGRREQAGLDNLSEYLVGAMIWATLGTCRSCAHFHRVRGVHAVNTP